MGIEPMTNGLLDQRSTNWAKRPCLLNSGRMQQDSDEKYNTVIMVTFKKKSSALGGTRTRNPQIRSLMRYPLRH